MTVLPLRHHASVEPTRPGDELVTVSVGPGGELIALWSTGLVTAHAPAPIELARIPAPTHRPRDVQPMPGERVLVVASRAGVGPDGPERNGIVYDADGEVVRAETLGDGILHVQATPSGRVWVGYFDEGTTGTAPIGVSGLVRFTSDLRLDWEFPRRDGGDRGRITDCYALNLDGETAWTCYYTGFPVARVQDGSVTTWRNELTGAEAILVGDDRFALAGGWESDRDRLAAGELDGDRFRVTGTYRLTLPDGAPLPPNVRIFCRGDGLHVVAGGEWYRLDLDDVPG